MSTPSKGKIYPLPEMIASLNFYETLFSYLYVIESELRHRIFNILQFDLGEAWIAAQLEVVDPASIFITEKKYICERMPKGFVLSGKELETEAGLGFWIEFFSKEWYKKTRGLPIKIFSSRPRQIKRKDIYSSLRKIKDLRNNLAHSRLPVITSKKQLVNIVWVTEIQAEMHAMLIWLDHNDLATELASQFSSRMLILEKTLTPDTSRI